MGKGEEDVVERRAIALAFQELARFEQHQHKAPAGALGPFPLHVQGMGEKLPAEEGARGQRI